MVGFDFWGFWQTGQAVLGGLNPYAVQGAVYPPATTLLFALFAIVPFQFSYQIWTGINVILFLIVLQKKQPEVPLKSLKKMLWLGFSPVLFILFVGQLDIFFLWLASFLSFRTDTFRRGWGEVLCAALITLKPQIAFVVLPWWLLGLARRDRRTLLIWSFTTLILHLLPLGYDFSIYWKWKEALQAITDLRLHNSPGFFSFSTIGVPFWVLALPSVVVMAWGLLQNERIARSTLMLAMPMGFWYENVLLALDAPALWMVPVSWAAFFLAAVWKNSIPFLLIPLGFMLWNAWSSFHNRGLSLKIAS
jgi:hypothetical protein